MIQNEGIEATMQDIVVFTDDDVLVAPERLGAIVRALQESGALSVVTGRVLAGDSPNGGIFAPSLHESDEREVSRGRTLPDPLATFNFAIKRSTLDEVGPFDTEIGPGTRFPYSEDNDYEYRLLKSGYTIVFDPSAVVYQRAWRTDENYLRVRYAYRKGQGGFYGKHLVLKDWFMFRKLIAAFGRRFRRMMQLGRLGILGELSWIAGLSEWLLLPEKRGQLFTNSSDGSKGW